MKKALIANERDNVATALDDIIRGEIIVILVGGKERNVRVLDDVNFGHKFALEDINLGKPVIKYGEPIGLASREIKVGEHVHIHNLESQRGRGDKNKKREV